MGDLIEIVSRARVGASLIGHLPELPGYNGSRLVIDDIEAERISTDVYAAIDALQSRITELEASLADSNEALQVMGLKLAHAEAQLADDPTDEMLDAAEGLYYAPPDNCSDDERGVRNLLTAIYKAMRGVHSANTVVGPTPGAAPACEPTRISSETIAAGHPCFDPDGPPDHDWEYVDDSFSHEFGTEICGHYECARCNAIKPE